MKIRRHAAAVVAIGAVLVLPLLAAPAHANGFTHLDEVGDVQAYVPPSDVGTPTPSVGDQDITTSSISQTARNLVVRVTLRDMTPISPHEVDAYFFAIRTPAMHRDVLWLTGAAHGEGNPRLAKVNGSPVKCRLSHTINRTTRTVALRVPRSCLGNPRWVEVAIATLNTSNATSTLYYDDALTGAAGSIDHPHYSQRVRR